MLAGPLFNGRCGIVMISSSSERSCAIFLSIVCIPGDPSPDGSGGGGGGTCNC